MIEPKLLIDDDFSEKKSLMLADDQQDFIVEQIDASVPIITSETNSQQQSCASDLDPISPNQYFGDDGEISKSYFVSKELFMELF